MDVFDLFAKISLDTSEYDQGLDAASGKTHSFGDKLKSGLATAAKAGAVAVGAATTAVGLFAKSSLDAGMSFDASMSKVGAISGAAAGDLEALRSKALEMGSSTKFSATEAADAMSYMAMAGWKAGDMLNGIEGIMNLAAASGEDLASVSDIVTDAMTAFGLAADGTTKVVGKDGLTQEVSNASHFADVLAAASSNANTNVGMMGETFKYVAPVAGALGYSVDDTALAIGLMANSGIKATQAGTALRSIFTRLSTDAGASSKSLGALGTLTQQLGVEFYNADGSTREFIDVLMDARGAWQGLSEEQQVNYATTIAGQEAMSGWLAMMNAAPEDVEKLASAIADADGAASDMADVMVDNLSGAITMFKSAMEGAQILLSDQLTPSLTEFVKFGTESVATLSKAFSEGGLDGMMDAMGSVITDGLSMVVSKLPEFINAGAQLLGALATGIANNVPTLFETAQGMLADFTEYLRENLPQLISTGLDALLSFSGGLREGAGQLVDSAITLIQTLADGLIQSLPELIAKVPEIVSNIAGIINDNAPKLLVTAGELIFKLAKGLVDNIPVILENMPKIIGAIWDTITAVNWIHLGATLLSSIGNGIMSMSGNLLNTVKGVLQHPINFIKGLFSSFKSMGSQIIQFFSSGMSGMVGSVLNVIRSIQSGIVGVIRGLISSAMGWGRDLISGFADGILGGIRLVTDAVKAVANKVTSFLHFSRPDEGPLRDYESWMPDFMDGLASGIRGNAWRVEDALGDLTGRMQADMSAPFSANITANGGGFGPQRTGMTYGDIHITVNGAQYSSEQSLARAIAEEIQFMAERGNAFAPA